MHSSQRDQYRHCHRFWRPRVGRDCFVYWLGLPTVSWVQRSRIAILFFCLGLFCLSQQPRAYWQSRDSNYNIAVASGAAPTTWDNSKRGTGITLSPNLLTATNGAGNSSSVLAIASATTGLRFFQSIYSTCATPGRCVTGLGNASTNLNSFLGSDTNSFGWAGDGSLFNCTGVGCGGIQTFAQGDTLSELVDLGHKTIFLRTNSGNWNNSALADPCMNIGGLDYSAVTGVIFPAIGTFSDATVNTVNFGGSAYSPAAPACASNF